MYHSYMITGRMMKSFTIHLWLPGYPTMNFIDIFISLTTVNSLLLPQDIRKLGKIKPVVDRLSKVFRTIYYPPLGANVVKTLMSPYRHTYQHVYFNNFFSSIALLSWSRDYMDVEQSVLIGKVFLSHCILWWRKAWEREAEVKLCNMAT